MSLRDASSALPSLAHRYRRLVEAGEIRKDASQEKAVAALDRLIVEISSSRLAAVAGYPHLTVPMGFDRGMPVGLSFIGGKWDDARILSLGHAYERATQARRPPVMQPR